MSKAKRMQAATRAAMKNPATAKTFLERVLDIYRLADVFTNPEYADEVSKLRAALAREGCGLSGDGRLEPLGDITLDTHDREALEEQLDRLRRNTEDAGLLLGAPKDLLESVGKHVLEESGQLPTRRMDFPEVMSLSRKTLDLDPSTVDMSTPGGKSVQKVYQAVKTITDAIGELRNAHGTGHGRTLPTGVSVETARYMIRQAVMIAELMLSTHDRSR